MSAEQRPVTNARVLSIAGPIVLSNATVPILGAVDAGVVGQIPDPVPLAAVGIGAVILSAIYWIFGFLRMGTVGLTSQALGAGDRAEADAVLSRALLIAGAGGLALIALQLPIFAAAFAVSPASAEVEAAARSYMQIRIWSAPAAIAVYGITGWLVAAERTRGILVLQLWMNGINIALDLLFVLGFGWGVEGVAIATLIAELSGAGMGLWLCRDAFARPHWRDGPRVFSRAPLLRMAAVNADILVRSLLLQAIFVSFLFFGASFGDVTLAANHVLLLFLEIVAFALDGFAFAAETLVGQAMGAGARAQLRRGAVLTSAWGLAVCILLALVFALAGDPLVALMSKSPEVQETARQFLPWMIVAPLIGLAAYMLDGIFIGATRTADMRNMMLVSAAIYFAAVWLLMPLMGNHGLWAALLISFVARGVTLGLRYPALERAVGQPG